MGIDKDWIRKDYERFMESVTRCWPAWKKAYLSTRFIVEKEKKHVGIHKKTQ